MGRCPPADLLGAAAQDGDIEGVDPDLQQFLGRTRFGRRRGGTNRVQLLRLRLADKTLERPVAALLDARRDSGSGVNDPNAPPPPANWKAVT